MQYKAILFDLDGTLLPMDMHDFMNGYFQFLGKRLEPYGMEYRALVGAILKGTAAMAANDGSAVNHDVFWKCFGEIMNKSPEECTRIDAECEDFYGNEFRAAKQFTGENPDAAAAVALCREKFQYVVLASNPVFPMPGHVTRLAWVDLKPSDFDLLTAYEDAYYSKPNPNYYLGIAEKLGVEPKDCLMIGNDELEDMYAATQACMSAYLITDCSIPSKEHPWQGPKGTFAEFMELLRSM